MLAKCGAHSGECQDISPAKFFEEWKVRPIAIDAAAFIRQIHSGLRTIKDDGWLTHEVQAENIGVVLFCPFLI